MSTILRRLSASDLEMTMRWRMLPEITKYMYTDPVLTLDDQKRWFESVSNDARSKYWIIQIDNGVDVGLINLCDIDRRNRQCAWAYYIADERARGRGLGKVLETNIYDYVFDRLELNKLWCEVFTFNEHVIQLHRKFGSEIEGTFRQHIYKNGEFHDIVRMGITASRWRELRGAMACSPIPIEN